MPVGFAGIFVAILFFAIIYGKVRNTGAAQWQVRVWAYCSEFSWQVRSWQSTMRR